MRRIPPVQAVMHLLCLSVLLLSTLSAQAQSQAQSQASPKTQQPSSPQADAAASGTPPLTPLSPEDAEIPVANPARPTVTNPATLPPVGYLQFEQGFVQANSSPDDLSHQFSLQQVIKLAVLPRLMFSFSWEPVAVTVLSNPGLPDTNTTGLGDLQGAVQAVLLNGSEHTPALAISYGRRLRSGDAVDLDVGSFCQSAVVYLSGNFHRFHYDANLVLNEQTQDQQPNNLRRAQYGQTLAVSHDIFPRTFKDNLSLNFELWRFTQPLLQIPTNLEAHNVAAGFLFAPSYSLRPNLVLDLGFNRGLTSTSTEWETFGGLTYLLPHRLWHHR